MAQAIEDWFICDGRYRIHAIGPLGRRSGRIIEIEEVDSRERFHGSASRLKKLMQTLRRSTSDDHGDALAIGRLVAAKALDPTKA